MKKRKKAASPRRRIARQRARRRRARARRARVAAPAPAPAPLALAPPAAAPPSASAPAVATQVEQRGRPIVAALARIARGSEPPRARLEQAIRLLLAAYGESDPDFSGLFLTGWARARHDKQFRLTLAWQREQIRLSLEDILTEGVRTRRFRDDLDAGAVAAVIVGAAEGCLLQAATEGGAVPAERLVGALLTLAVSGA
ncbi:MAG TPA: TetR family transcriptional regulator C-terminal domain-containing protein [Methylomirabilota bacterium]|nr:TetR family transcriptional regulator C-terminal domain-containing protein [Methylomirabilota bacterium]